MPQGDSSRALGGWAVVRALTGEVTRTYLGEQRDQAIADAVDSDKRLVEGAAAAKRREAKRAAEARLAKQRSATAESDKWWPIAEGEIPAGVRFDVPRGGQAGSSDPYKRVTDQSLPSSDPSRVRYYKRREV